MASKPVAMQSILAADIGSTMTKTVLIDVVEGEYRILASAEFPSTLEPPWSDVSLAVLQCISRLEQIAARALLEGQTALITPEQPNGSGVDAFVATASAAEPLRVAIAGLMRDYSVESARKAAFSTYALTESVSALDAEAQRGQRWDLPARLEALHTIAPAVIVLVGGSDQGANAPLLDVASAVAMACKTWQEATKPDVIFAGNAGAREQVAAMIGESARLSVTDNVRPAVDTEMLAPLENELEALFTERRLNRLPGIGRIASSSDQPVVAASKAFGAGVRALARHFESQTLGIDVGGATTTMAVSDRGHFQRVQRSDLGVSHNIENVARAAGIADILRWLPFEMSEDEAWDLLAGKSARPYTLPASRRELLLEQAVTREAIRLTMRDLRDRWHPSTGSAASSGRSSGRGSGRPPAPGTAVSPSTGSGRVSSTSSGQGSGIWTPMPPIDLVVGSGGVLTHAPTMGQVVLMLLDGLQPGSVVNLALDTGGLLAPLSLIASVQPQAAAQLAAREGISALGTAVCPIGSAKLGDVVVTYKITYPDGGTVGGEVKAGEIEVLPLPIGQKAAVELKPARQIDLGQGRGRAGITNAEGGTVGLIIDARGRPLVLPNDAAKRAELNQQWLYNVGA